MYGYWYYKNSDYDNESTETKEKCAKDHDLKKTTANPYRPGMYIRCDVCGGGIIRPTRGFYHCDVCSYDRCAECNQTFYKFDLSLKNEVK